MEPEKQALLNRLNAEIQFNLQLQTQLITVQRELDELKQTQEKAKE